MSLIRVFGQPMAVACDARCDKAWGRSSRPRRPGTDDYIPDAELGTAPVCPDSNEGGDVKPLSPDAFPNRWCVRECERCQEAGMGEHVKLPEFL